MFITKSLLLPKKMLLLQEVNYKKHCPLRTIDFTPIGCRQIYKVEQRNNKSIVFNLTSLRGVPACHH